MKLYVFLVAILFSLFASAKSTFTLYGEININSGTVTLVPEFLSKYYPTHKEVSATIKNHSFTISDTVIYPCAYRILVKQNGTITYISGTFLIDTGKQYITCDTNLLRQCPKLTKSDYCLQQFLTTHNNNSILSYATLHPHDYTVLWYLANALSSDYEPIYDSIFKTLDITLQNTITGQSIYKDLQFLKRISIGCRFPDITLLDTVDKLHTPFKAKPIHKYTLVDFWFSTCTPCIRQFASLKNYYNQYHSHKLEIIGISIDDTNRAAMWKQLIIEKQLPWQQYRDINLKNASDFCITSYPTNFLLDENGTIIKKDISMKELERMLAE